MANQRNQQLPQGAQVVYVQQQKQSHGCLVTALVFVLFGWIGLAVIAAWKLTKVAWALLVTYPLRWSVAGIRATARGASWLTARYGWRGWAVAGGVVVALAIFGGILQAVGAH